MLRPPANFSIITLATRRRQQRLGLLTHRGGKRDSLVRDLVEMHSRDLARRSDLAALDVGHHVLEIQDVDLRMPSD